MSIRIKLIMTYMIMITISAIILITSSFSFVANLFFDVTNVIFEDKQLEEVAMEVVDLLAELKNAEMNNPSILLDEDFMMEIDNRISDFSSSLIVEYENEFINVGNLNVSDEFYNELLDERPSQHGGMENTISYQDSMYSFIDYEFTYLTNTITYYFVLDVSELKDIRVGFGGRFIFLLIIILLIVIVPLTYILSKDIIQPLRRLEKGTMNIKEGNLDFKLEVKSKNEIGRVIQSFDKMRFELKKSIEQQIQYEENRKELISSISHDLKTPITSIKGHVEGIMDGVANTPEKLEKYLHVIYNKSEHMDRLINDLFLFSKLDLNRLPFDMENVSISRFMEDVIDELKLEYSKQDIVINMNNKVKSEAKVIMDGQMIKRVIFNIVQNAIKFINKDEKILNVDVQEDEHKVVVRIEDNGIGIEPEQLSVIFDKFYRVDESRSTKNSGTGLGLSIAKQIIEAHQGEIWAKSKLGEGTTICFTLKKALFKE